MREKIDLSWDDKHVVPPVVYPDLDFLFQRMTEATLEAINAGKSETILDIGCGRAIDAIQLAKRGATVIGLEPSRVMLNHAREHIAMSGKEIALVQGIGEFLPFKDCSLDKVVCKGSLDHFVEPAKALEQIAKILRPEGKAIIAIANFESLGFKIGKIIDRVLRIFKNKKDEDKRPWQLPPDHTIKFDYPLLKQLIRRHLKVEQAIGVSLLFGLPWWGQFLAKLPRSVTLAILRTLDKIGYHFPFLSDAIIVRCSPIAGRG